MRKISRSSAFKRDYKRVKSISHHRNIDILLPAIVKILANDQVLPTNNRDHSLTGNWVGYRECHIKPDLLLIYRKQGKNVLRLARLGSHSELF